MSFSPEVADSLILEVIGLLHPSFRGTIDLETDPTFPSPIVLYRPDTQSGEERYTVRLATQGTSYPCQFVYQFSHEFCHILSGHDRLRGSLNTWFHESICQAASCFAIKGISERLGGRWMGVDWEGYLDAVLAESGPICGIVSFVEAYEDWLRVREPYDEERRRATNRMGASLYPILHRFPSWSGAVRRLPRGDARVGDYLMEWSEKAELEERSFVNTVAVCLIGRHLPPA